MPVGISARMPSFIPTLQQQALSHLKMGFGSRIHGARGVASQRRPVLALRRCPQLQLSPVQLVVEPVMQQQGVCSRCARVRERPHCAASQRQPIEHPDTHNSAHLHRSSKPLSHHRRFFSSSHSRAPPKESSQCSGGCWEAGSSGGGTSGGGCEEAASGASLLGWERSPWPP